MNLRPHKALKPGRYALDWDGRLHPLRRRYWVNVVAIVHIKAKPPARPALGTIAPPDCVPEPHPRMTPTRKEKLAIDLSQVPSSMELRAASWKGKP